MRVWVGSLLVCAALSMVQCKTRFDGVDSRVGSKEPTDSVEQIPALAFNAWNLWNGAKESPRFSVQKVNSEDKSGIVPDGVFFAETSEFYKDGKEVPLKPTSGVKVTDRVLEYPVKNGKQLRLQFSLFTHSDNTVSHDAAWGRCASEGLRLPTMRELMDFCLTESCGDIALWSATRVADRPSDAWRMGGIFEGADGKPLFKSHPASANRRENRSAGVMCVGGV